MYDYYNFKDVSELKKIGFFPKKPELVEFVVLRYLAKSEEPIGSWGLQVMLEMGGLKVSTATIGRLLKKLDTKQFTKLIEAQGRIITPLGRKFVSETEEEINKEYLNVQLMEATSPNSVEDLRDLLIARCVIEKETCRIATTKATAQDFKVLDQLMQSHKLCVESNQDRTALAFEFHRYIAQISENKVLMAILDILINEQIKLESHYEGIVSEYQADECDYMHQKITEAMKGKDAELAVNLMDEHIIGGLIEDLRTSGRIED